MHHVHRGRRLIAAYIIIHLVVTAAILLIGWRLQARLDKKILSAVYQTVLIHQLWRGSRWAQWVQAASYGMYAVGIVLLLIQRPHPVLIMILVPVALMCAWLAFMFAFSRSIREFLAHQRAQHGRSVLSVPAPAAPVAAPVPSYAAASGDWAAPLFDADPGGSRENEASPCRSCGAMLKNFVVLCPDCGTRREAEF